MTLEDFGNLASIISLIVGIVLGVIGCKTIGSINQNKSNFKNVRAKGDIVGRDKIIKE